MSPLRNLTSTRGPRGRAHGAAWLLTAGVVALGLAASGRARAAGEAAHAVGHYGRGTLQGGVAYPAEGPDHYVVYRPHCYVRPALAELYADPAKRNVHYGHPWAVAETLAALAEFRRADPAAPRVGLGEASAPQGGQVPYHHSHQNGLDIDVFYVLRDAVAAGTPLPQHDGAFPVAFCRDGPHLEVREPRTGAWLVHPDFDLARNWALLAAFAERPSVRTIFVGSLLRAHIERWAARNVPRPARARVLRRLEPVVCPPPPGSGSRYFNGNFCPHDDHLHVRYFCPPADTACRG